MKARLFFCIFVLFFSACVAKNHAQRKPLPGESEFAWKAYQSRASSHESSAFRLDASLRYSGPDISSGRVSALLWGNAPSTSLYPLRLDLTAGLGTVVAKIREDTHTFLAYIPQKNLATTYPKQDKGLLAFGIPIPLSLGDLTLLLTGHSGDLFLPKHMSGNSPVIKGVTAEGLLYGTPEAKIPGVIELSPNGSLLSWKENTPNGWSIAFENNQSLPLQPKKISITYPQGYKAIIIVNDITLVKQSFSESQLLLPLPKGTVTK